MKNLLRTFTLLLTFTLTTPAFAAEIPAANTPAPDFTLPSQDGKPVSLSDYAGKWVVLYFYPKDFTSGCSIQAHKFQEDLAKYHAKNAVILGVSVDSVASHKEFCTKQNLEFTLLADEEHKVSSLYGSYDGLLSLGMASRNTFLIDPKGVIRKVYESVKPASHSAEVLKDLTELQSPAT